MLTLNDIRWCAEECERQHTGPREVSCMCDALEYAREGAIQPWDFKTVLALGLYIEPIKNRFGFRTVPVTLPSSPIALPPQDYNKLLFRLMENRDLSAAEGYQEFEALHPFVDGNGRVGAILYNYWKGTLNKGPLVVPPPFEVRHG